MLRDICICAGPCSATSASALARRPPAELGAQREVRVGGSPGEVAGGSRCATPNKPEKSARINQLAIRARRSYVPEALPATLPRSAPPARGLGGRTDSHGRMDPPKHRLTRMGKRIVDGYDRGLARAVRPMGSASGIVDILGRASPNGPKKSIAESLAISGLPIPAQFRACHGCREPFPVSR